MSRHAAAVKDAATVQNELTKGELPKHVGIIMDGNGRWAEMRQLERIEGHKEGSNSVREVTRAARRLGLKALTLYAFSAQNWARPANEVAGLMNLLREYLLKEREEILENNIRLNAIGDLEKLPKWVSEPLSDLRHESSKNDGMVLTLALSYGGREEIVQAVREIAEKIDESRIHPSDISENLVEQHLSTAGLPPVDLVIRTSGESRVSNFLLWQAAYAEFIFTEILWPDFRAEALHECLRKYQSRERRYGLTSSQIQAAQK